MSALPAYAVRGWVAVSTGPSQSAPLYWMDESFDKRVVIEATNASGGDLQDYLLTATVPAGIDTGSVTAVELTVDLAVDNSYVWRYAQNVNRMPQLPMTLDGTTATIKTLGRWPQDATRYFAIYWDTSSAVTRYVPAHLRGVHNTWTATVTAGTTGDTYRLVIGGTNYTHVMTAGQTATQIADALRVLINAGADALGTGTTGAITINPADIHDDNAAFTVTNTGSTVPGNVVLVSPATYSLQRRGPDTDGGGATTGSTLRLPLRSSGLPSSAGSRAAIVRSTAEEMLRLFTYKLNGDATIYGFTTGTITDITNDGPTVTVSGTLGGSTHWSGTYTAVYQNKLCSLDKTDGTEINNVLKPLDMVRVDMTLTCIQAYTPLNDAGAGTSVLNQFALSVTSSMGFALNSTTLLADQVTDWYATTTTPLAAISTNGDTAAMAVTNSIVGNSGNTGSMAVLVHSATLSGFSPQSPILKWWGTDLQLASTSSASQIPLGATIDLDFTFAHSNTSSATVTGDNMVGRELLAILQRLSYVATPTVGDTETYSEDSLADTMAASSTRTVTGIQWFIDNALTYTNNANNIAYAATPLGGSVRLPDDDDGSYGVGHVVHGACLRYLRTHDATTLALIERLVQFHLDIEADAIAAYGSTLGDNSASSGCTPYWYNPFLVPYTHAIGDVTQPGLPRSNSSIDQMHMVAHGLYAYLYLLRNEPAVTANTVLRANVLAFLDRMRSAAEPSLALSTASRVCGNLYNICTGTTPTNTNGITEAFFNTESASVISNPYHGGLFRPWQISDTEVRIDPSSNISIDDFFRGLYSPDSTEAGVINYLRGRTKDMLATDLGRHDVIITDPTWGSPGPYPEGWLPRASNSDIHWHRFDSGRDGDDHYLELGSGGIRDLMTGRTAQRGIVVALLALYDPTFMVPIEMTGGVTVVREVNVVTALNAIVRTVATYLTEPISGAQRFSAGGYGGKGEPTWIDIAPTGYWMMLVELWHLVNAGADVNDYYPIGAW